MEQLRTHVDGGVQSLAELLVPPPQEEEASSVKWRLADGRPRPRIDSRGRHSAYLASNCLKVFWPAIALHRASRVSCSCFDPPPRNGLPQLLKDLGEAYYRWQPKTAPGNNLFEEALVRFLQTHLRECRDLQFPSSWSIPASDLILRDHNAASRGVEIVQVLGWIVLRDNGKVYTKAAVEVR